jgi:hypothetical protein
MFKIDHLIRANGHRGIIVVITKNASNAISSGLVCRQSYQLLLVDMALEAPDCSGHGAPGTPIDPKMVDWSSYSRPWYLQVTLSLACSA